MMFCSNCGTQLSDSARFCPSCGQGVFTKPGPTVGAYQQPTPSVPTALPGTQVLKNLSTMELISAIVWVVIAALQAVSAVNTLTVLLTVGSYADAIGLGNLLGGSWVSAISLLAVASWNGYYAYKTFVFSGQLKRNPPADVIQRYEKALVSLIVVLVVMLFVSIIGVLGAIYSLIIRGYALSHQEDIQRVLEVGSPT